MHLVFSVVIGTTFLMTAEQALEAAATAVESEIAAFDSAFKQVLKTGTDFLSEFDATVVLNISEPVAADAVETIAVNAESTDTEVVEALIVTTAVVDTEISDSALVATDILEPNDVETVSVQSQNVDDELIEPVENADVVVIDAVETEVAETDAIAAEVIAADVVDTAPIETTAVAPALTEAVTTTSDGDIAWQSDQLTNAWPDLSEHTRATILMLIEADQMMRD